MAPRLPQGVLQQKRTDDTYKLVDAIWIGETIARSGVSKVLIGTQRIVATLPDVTGSRLSPNVKIV